MSAPRLFLLLFLTLACRLVAPLSVRIPLQPEEKSSGN